MRNEAALNEASSRTASRSLFLRKVCATNLVLSGTGLFLRATLILRDAFGVSPPGLSPASPHPRIEDGGRRAGSMPAVPRAPEPRAPRPQLIPTQAVPLQRTVLRPQAYHNPLPPGGPRGHPATAFVFSISKAGWPGESPSAGAAAEVLARQGARGAEGFPGGNFFGDGRAEGVGDGRGRGRGAGPGGGGAGAIPRGGAACEARQGQAVGAADRGLQRLRQLPPPGAVPPPPPPTGSTLHGQSP